MFAQPPDKYTHDEGYPPVLEEGDDLEMPDIRARLEAREKNILVLNHTRKTFFYMICDVVSDREMNILLAGGLMNWAAQRVNKKSRKKKVR